MRLASSAWNEVDTTSIRNCWQKAGILPTTSSPLSPVNPSLPILSLIHASKTHTDPTLQAEALVGSALDDLEATRALQRSNCMNLAEILNPAAEMHNIFEATDKDIFEAVMGVKAVQELNMGGSDEVSDGNDDSSTPTAALGPTQKDAIQASLLLREYVKDIDDPFTCKLELMLGSFGQRT
ncbi:hypothetical protein EDD16DRAFT_1483007 [Pisolithus croceorrhizus]|nr:hypothetical protein EV401DRAFT_1894651 [Pisolithus croceorrhizus]KAI6115088.1 hypothetical protein EDD16DRAFT_1483007 [Pisolithus croceorrhizus]